MLNLDPISLGLNSLIGAAGLWGQKLFGWKEKNRAQRNEIYRAVELPAVGEVAARSVERAKPEKIRLINTSE